MNPLNELRRRFLAALQGLTDRPEEQLDLVRRSQDARFGDYQANMAMPLAKVLRRPPREVAQAIIDQLDVADMCEPPEIAGPGFINLRLRAEWLAARLEQAARDDRLGIPRVEHPRTYVVDFSAPNVAKPLHVGHIRSTVIGDAINRTLRFVGHRVISDNHVGDWGTQFGILIYGWRHFLDHEAFRRNPVAELVRVYRLVHQLLEKQSQTQAANGADAIARDESELSETGEAQGDRLDDDSSAGAPGASADQSFAEKAPGEKISGDGRREGGAPCTAAPADIEQLSLAHPDINAAVLNETAKLHHGDPENRRIWQEIVNVCRGLIDHVYQRLGVEFDETRGESFYEPMLPEVVETLISRGIARESHGAICVFIDGIEAPMIVRKQDGAFLYATTDLATIVYRMNQWQPDAILYVVDHRQSLHFRQLFAVARMLGYDQVDLRHISFGTVLGEDGRPFKTRSGALLGLERLLDEAVARAARIVAENDDAKPGGPDLSPQQRAQIAEAVGIAAIKYADLSQNRTSDYVFSFDKMLAMTGNTATYMQYAYARVRSIFSKGGVDPQSLRSSPPPLLLDTAAERALALELVRFEEALDSMLVDFRPNQLTAYLFDLANCYSAFFESCPVLRAENDGVRRSRLLLCDLTARTLQKGLELLGINVLERM